MAKKFKKILINIILPLILFTSCGQNSNNLEDVLEFNEKVENITNLDTTSETRKISFVGEWIKLDEESNIDKKTYIEYQEKNNPFFVSSVSGESDIKYLERNGKLFSYTKYKYKSKDDYYYEPICLGEIGDVDLEKYKKDKIFVDDLLQFDFNIIRLSKTEQGFLLKTKNRDYINECGEYSDIKSIVVNIAPSNYMLNEESLDIKVNFKEKGFNMIYTYKISYIEVSSKNSKDYIYQGEYSFDYSSFEPDFLENPLYTIAPPSSFLEVVEYLDPFKATYIDNYQTAFFFTYLEKGNYYFTIDNSCGEGKEMVVTIFDKNKQMMPSAVGLGTPLLGSINYFFTIENDGEYYLRCKSISDQGLNILLNKSSKDVEIISLVDKETYKGKFSSERDFLVFKFEAPHSGNVVLSDVLFSVYIVYKEGNINEKVVLLSGENKKIEISKGDNYLAFRPYTLDSSNQELEYQFNFSYNPRTEYEYTDDVDLMPRIGSELGVQFTLNRVHTSINLAIELEEDSAVKFIVDSIYPINMRAGSAYEKDIEFYYFKQGIHVIEFYLGSITIESLFRVKAEVFSTVNKELDVKLRTCLGITNGISYIENYKIKKEQEVKYWFNLDEELPIVFDNEEVAIYSEEGKRLDMPPMYRDKRILIKLLPGKYYFIPLITRKNSNKLFVGICIGELNLDTYQTAYEIETEVKVGESKLFIKNHIDDVEYVFCNILEKGKYSVNQDTFVYDMDRNRIDTSNTYSYLDLSQGIYYLVICPSNNVDKNYSYLISKVA